MRRTRPVVRRWRICSVRVRVGMQLACSWRSRSRGNLGGGEVCDKKRHDVLGIAVRPRRPACLPRPRQQADAGAKTAWMRRQPRAPDGAGGRLRLVDRRTSARAAHPSCPLNDPPVYAAHTHHQPEVSTRCAPANRPVCLLSVAFDCSPRRCSSCSRPCAFASRPHEAAVLGPPAHLRRTSTTPYTSLP